MYLTLILLIINQDPKFISIIKNYLVVYKISNTKIKILNLKQKHRLNTRSIFTYLWHTEREKQIVYKSSTAAQRITIQKQHVCTKVKNKKGLPLDKRTGNQSKCFDLLMLTKWRILKAPCTDVLQPNKLITTVACWCYSGQVLGTKPL